MFNLKNINRLREILLVFFEEGFGFIIQKIGLLRFIPLSKRFKAKLRKEPINLPQRLRKSFERLGPVFIKFGQFLSLRPDLVPENYIKELEKLQDSAPAFPFSEVKKIVEKELGPINKLFKDFNRKPIASASVSQVHKAKLKNGKLVAVKVQRPGIKEIFEKDTSLLLFIATLLEKHFNLFNQYGIIDFVKEFRRWSADEINFNTEASNAKLLRQNFKNSKDVLIPQVIKSSEKTLVMEFVDGMELSNIGQVKKLKKKNYIKFVDSAYEAVLRMIFDHGFFHADPHPANILVLRKSNRIAFIDFGIVGYFDEELKSESLHLFDSIIKADVEELVKSLMSIGSVEVDIDETEFKKDLRVIINQLRFSSLEDIEVSKVLRQAFDISLKHKIKFPVDFVLFAKTVITLEGIGLRYNPNFKLVEQSRPFITKLIKKRISPKKILSDLRTTTANYKELIDTLPETALNILQKVKKGRVKVDIEDTDIRNLTIEMEKSTGNLTIGLIVAALIVGSSLISQIENQPQFLGFPLAPLLGFIIAGLLSIWILHRTLFSKYVKSQR